MKPYLRAAIPRRKLNDGELGWVEGVIIPFTGPDRKDTYGTYWTRETDLGLTSPVYSRRPLYNRHGLQDPEPAGYLDDEYLEVGDDGLFAGGVVFDTPAGREFLRACAEENAYFSTAALPHMIELADDGRVVRWPFVEASQTQNPAAFRGETKIYVRSADADRLQVGGIFMPEQTENAADNQQPNVIQLTEEQFQQLIARPDTGPEYVRDDGTVDLTPDEQNPVNPIPGYHRVAVGSRWDDVDLTTMLLLREVAYATQPRPTQHMRETFDETYYRAVLDKAQPYLRQDDEVERAFRDADQASQMQDWMRAISDEAYHRWHKVIPYMRADEAMGSTVSTAGDELVPTLAASVIWHHVQLASVVSQNIPQIDLPSNPYDMPTITGGPTFRLVPEIDDQTEFTVAASNITTSQIGTSKVTFSTKQIGALTLYSDKLLNASNTELANAFAREFVTGTAHAIDRVLLEGDESATVENISFYGTDPTDTVFDYVLALEGLRAIAAANSDSAAVATIAATGYVNALRKLMGTAGKLGVDPNDLVLFCDPATYYKIMELTQVLTMDVLGPKATILTGQVSVLNGVKVLPTEDMELANASGQIEDGSGTVRAGTKGQTVIIKPSMLRLGWLRRPQIEATKVPHTTGWAISTYMDMDLQAMEAGAVAHGYNHTV
jgi:HK97 family phage major capsid protein